MLSLLLPVLTGAVVGAAVSVLCTWWLLRRHRTGQALEPAPSDPWLDAEIDRAAATWASEQGHPEAAGLMADKLHLLHRLGSRRRTQ